MSYQEIITQDLSAARAELINRVMEYHEAMHRREENPSQVIKVQNVQMYPNGMPIASIAAVRIPAILESRAKVAVLEQMLAEVAGGNLEKRWSDEMLIDPTVATIAKKDLE